MFNIFEGNKDEKALKLRKRLIILRRAYEGGFFDEGAIVAVPEIVADGTGPDDTVRKQPTFVKHEDAATPNPGNTAVLPNDAPTPSASQPLQPCPNCNRETRHVTYGQGTPTWHCAVCCTCEWCVQTLVRQAGKSTEGMTKQQKIDHWEEIVHGRKALVEAVAEGQGLFFCTKCGAGLRCSVCNNEATGNHCDLCGTTIGPEGFCLKCWKEAD